MKKDAYTYIITNSNNTVLYTGVTTNLLKRIAEHRSGILRGFSYKYNCRKLVFYHRHFDVHRAIEEEKLLKATSRKKKIALIEKMNPDWRDLWIEIGG